MFTISKVWRVILCSMGLILKTKQIFWQIINTQLRALIFGISIWPLFFQCQFSTTHSQYPSELFWPPLLPSPMVSTRKLLTSILSDVNRNFPIFFYYQPIFTLYSFFTLNQTLRNKWVQSFQKDGQQGWVYLFIRARKSCFSWFLVLSPHATG